MSCRISSVLPSISCDVSIAVCALLSSAKPPAINDFYRATSIFSFLEGFLEGECLNSVYLLQSLQDHLLM